MFSVQNMLDKKFLMLIKCENKYYNICIFCLFWCYLIVFCFFMCLCFNCLFTATIRRLWAHGPTW